MIKKYFCIAPIYPETFKLAYLIPLREIIENIISLHTHDTVVLGKIQLPDSTVIIKNQTSEKVRDEIRKRGYKVFDIQGVKELDPAYLEDAETNINHRINFLSVTRNQNFSYAENPLSMDSLHVIDEYLSMIDMAVRGSALIKSYGFIIGDVEKRLKHFKEKFGTNPTFSEPLSRLGRGVRIFTNALQSLKALKEKSISGTEYNLRRKAIENTLRWENNTHFSDN